MPANPTSSNVGIVTVDTGSLAAEGVGAKIVYGISASLAFVDFSSGKINEVNVGRANGKITCLIDSY